MTELERVQKELAQTKAILADLLQEQGYGAKGADSVIEMIGRGATPDNLRTIAILNGDDEDSKRKLAEGILYRIYRGWIQSTSDEIVRCVLDGEIEDEDGLRERLDQECESAMIHTHDNYTVIFAADSNSTSAGAEQAQEYGASGAPDENVNLWATLIYKHDVERRLGDFGLADGDFDREIWLEAAREGEHDDQYSDLPPHETISARARRAT